MDDASSPTGPLSRRAVLRTMAVSAGVAAAAPLLPAARARADVPVYLDPAAPLDQRVDAILALMTDEQKLSCFTGIPDITLRDGYRLGGIGNGGVEGLHGSGLSVNATMFPQAIGLGSTWDTELLEAVGNVVGFETRSKNANALRVWAPVSDLRSNPLAGRFEEGFGEDPFLCGTLGTAYALGIKGRHPLYILAKPELKHFFAYNHEWNRARSSSSMSIRALREFHVVSYQMPIAAGAVLGAMSAYNLVNGVPSIIHPIMRTVRDEWAPGNFMFVPDAWDMFNLYNTKGAPYVYPLVRPPAADISYAAALSPDAADDTTNRNTTGALLLHAGITHFHDGNEVGFDGAAAARNAVTAGLLGVSMDHVDRMIRDWLAYKIRTGALDGAANPYNSTVIPPNPTPQELQSSKDLALRAAREQVVLLKNDRGVLPLAPRRVRRLAVIGPLAEVNLRDYYSPQPPDALRVTPLQGIAAKLGADRVDFVAGTDVVAWQSTRYGTFVTAGTGTAPMTADFKPSEESIDGGFPLPDGTHVGPAQAFQVYDWGYDQHLFRSVATGHYVDTDQAAITWSTELRTSQPTMVDVNTWFLNENFHYLRNDDGTRSIYGVNYIQDDQFYRWFTNGQYVIADSAPTHILRPTLDHAAFTGGGEAVRGPAKFTEHVLEGGAARAAAAAAAADYAVVVIGNEVLVNARESQDRPGLALSPQQAELVRVTAAARPGRTVVVIVSSYPYAVREIEDNPDVAAILYTSHAGQAAGTALADVLFGEYAPAGRLTSTWLVDESSLPAMGPDTDGHDPLYTVDMLEYDVIAARLTYRYSDAPYVYPFGHGLTYSEFRYRNLRVDRAVSADRTFDVHLELTNVGKHTSDEVVQVYLRSRASAYGRRVPKKQLVGFTRAKALAPGETREISVRVNPRDAFVWDVITQQPVVETGRYHLMVGASSADIRLATTIHVQGHTIGTLDLTTTRNVWEYYTIGHGVTHWEVAKANTLARRGGYHSVASRRAGDHVGFTRVELGGVDGIVLRVATTTASWADVRDPAVEVRINRPTGPLLGTLRFGPTGGLQDFTTVRARLRIRSAARHADLYLVFRAGGIYLDTIRLLRSRAE